MTLCCFINRKKTLCGYCSNKKIVIIFYKPFILQVVLWIVCPVMPYPDQNNNENFIRINNCLPLFSPWIGTLFPEPTDLYSIRFFIQHRQMWVQRDILNDYARVLSNTHFVTITCNSLLSLLNDASLSLYWVLGINVGNHQ